MDPHFIISVQGSLRGECNRLAGALEGGHHRAPVTSIPYLLYRYAQIYSTPSSHHSSSMHTATSTHTHAYSGCRNPLERPAGIETCAVQTVIHVPSQGRTLTYLLTYLRSKPHAMHALPEKAQHEPHCAWLRTGGTMPAVTQFTSVASSRRSCFLLPLLTVWGSSVAVAAAFDVKFFMRSWLENWS